jgi:hypothetical protein
VAKGNPNDFANCKIVTYRKKRGWGYQIIYTERGSDRAESNLDTYPTKALAEQAARDVFAKLALRWNLEP